MQFNKTFNITCKIGGSHYENMWKFSMAIILVTVFLVPGANMYASHITWKLTLTFMPLIKKKLTKSYSFQYRILVRFN